MYLFFYIIKSVNTTLVTAITFKRRLLLLLLQ